MIPCAPRWDVGREKIAQLPFAAGAATNRDGRTRSCIRMLPHAHRATPFARIIARKKSDACRS